MLHWGDILLIQLRFPEKQIENNQAGKTENGYSHLAKTHYKHQLQKVTNHYLGQCNLGKKC